MGIYHFHDPEVFPWSTTHFYLVVSWIVFFWTSEKKNLNKTVSQLTAVDSDTYWPKIIYIEDKYSANIIWSFEEIVFVATQGLSGWSMKMELSLKD